MESSKRNNNDDGGGSTTASAVIPVLVCDFTAKNFQAAMDALQAMGTIAERENHHPDFHLTNYRDVRIEIFTHKFLCWKIEKLPKIFSKKFFDTLNRF